MEISVRSVLPFKEHALNSLKGALLVQELSSEDDTNNFKKSSLKFTRPTIINKGIVFLQIDNFMKRIVLYSTTQSAKRENSRKETALLKVTNDIFLKMKPEHIVPLVISDLSRIR